LGNWLDDYISVRALEL